LLTLRVNQKGFFYRKESEAEVLGVFRSLEGAWKKMEEASQRENKDWIKEDHYEWIPYPQTLIPGVYGWIEYQDGIKKVVNGLYIEPNTVTRQIITGDEMYYDYTISFEKLQD
jgi:hypothetical protein